MNGCDVAGDPDTDKAYIYTTLKAHNPNQYNDEKDCVQKHALAVKVVVHLEDVVMLLAIAPVSQIQCVVRLISAADTGTSHTTACARRQILSQSLI